MTATRLAAYGVTLAVALALLSPLARPAREDGFPISSYPMFAAGRRDRVMTVDHVVGVDAAGRRRALSPALVAHGNVMQAAMTISQRISHGQADSLCREVAARLAARGRRGLLRVEVASDAYDAVAYFEGAREPVKRAVHAECAVPR